MKFTSILAAGFLAGAVAAADVKQLGDFAWDKPEGYAQDNPVGGPVSGGKGGATVTVTDYAALATAAAGNEPRVIKIVNSVKADARVIVGSNKSLIGMKHAGSIFEKGITVANATNVIIQNLKINNIVGNDAITVTNSTRVWIDHNELFSDNLHGMDYYVSYIIRPD